MTRQALGILGLGVGGKGLAVAGGNGLLDNLIAYWPGDEASGNLIDAHTNGLDLADQNTVTNNTGKVYATARQYTRAQSEYHSVADNAHLSTGDVDFTIAAWVYLDSQPFGSLMGIVTKDVSGGPREYLLDWQQATPSRFLWNVYNGVSTSIGSALSTFGEPAIGTWYLVVVDHDSVANTVSIQANNGAKDSAGTSGTPGDGAAPFWIGANVANCFWDGRIGPTAMWKSAAGAGGVLTSAQRTSLYNGGTGLTYASFTS